MRGQAGLARHARQLQLHHARRDAAAARAQEQGGGISGAALKGISCGRAAIHLRRAANAAWPTGTERRLPPLPSTTTSASSRLSQPRDSYCAERS